LKEAYAVRRTVPPSAEIEVRIEQLLAVGVGENPRETLSELARLGARLIIQRAVEDEFDAWLGRARYERRPEYQRGLTNYGEGYRNGYRRRTVQSAEGELEIEIPQVREAAETFVSALFPRARKLIATEPLRAMVIGAFVRGLSMRDVESLCEKAGLGKVAKSTAQRICTELRDRFQAFQRRDLYDIRLVALFLDATFLAVRPDGPKEGVQIAWGFTEEGQRVLLAVRLGMRESFEDWQELGRDHRRECHEVCVRRDRTGASCLHQHKRRSLFSERGSLICLAPPASRQASRVCWARVFYAVLGLLLGHRPSSSRSPAYRQPSPEPSRSPGVRC
jgi:putative transposase